MGDFRHFDTTVRCAVRRSHLSNRLRSYHTRSCQTRLYTYRSDFSQERLLPLSLGWCVLQDFRLDVLRQCVLLRKLTVKKNNKNKTTCTSTLVKQKNLWKQAPTSTSTKGNNILFIRWCMIRWRRTIFVIRFLWTDLVTFKSVNSSSQWAIFTKRRSGGIMAAMRLFWQSRSREAQTRFLYCVWVQKYYTKYIRPCQKRHASAIIHSHAWWIWSISH